MKFLIIIALLTTSVFTQCSDEQAKVKKAVALLAPIERRDLRTQDLTKKLALPWLTDLQLAIIRDAFPLLAATAKAEAGGNVNNLDARKQKWLMRIPFAFTKQQAFEVFEQVDAEIAAKYLKPGLDMSMLPDCACSTWWTWCESGSSCPAGGSGCSHVINCGPLGWGECDGKGCTRGELEIQAWRDKK